MNTSLLVQMSRQLAAWDVGVHLMDVCLPAEGIKSLGC